MSKKQELTPDTQSAEAAAEWAALDSLKGWPKNPRKNKRTIGRVAALLKRFGWGRPLGARREDGELIWGHSAAGAAHQLRREYKERTEAERATWHPDAVRTATTGLVPVRFRDDLTPDEAHELALADNRSQESSEWDEDLLKEQLADMTLGETALLGWSGKELEEVLGFEDDTEEDGEQKLGGGLTYSIVVECEDELQQADLMARLESEGFSCKPLVT